MKKIISVFLFLIVFVSLHAQDEKQLPSRFNWDIKFVKLQPLDFFPVSETITMKTEDVFMFSVKPEQSAYCYIIYSMPSGKVAVINNQKFQGGAEKFIGPFRLVEPAGTETIHIIMSMERQTNLENLIQDFNKDTKNKQNADNLLQEVAKLKSLASLSGGTEGEYIPLEIDGLKQHVTRFSNNSLYVRTVIIQHNALLKIM